jgi:3-deoxy-7-phosphoheptulonate synthase
MTQTEPLPDVGWEPASWQQRAAAQQPDWPDHAALGAAVAELRQLPPLVFAGEARSLQQSLARVAEGEGFVLHAGDCAESWGGGGGGQHRAPHPVNQPR